MYYKTPRLQIGRFSIQIHISRGRQDNGAVVKAMIGTAGAGPFTIGAGYIGGATAYLGVRTVRGGGGVAMYRPAAFRIGVTRNANVVPYVRS